MALAGHAAATTAILVCSGGLFWGARRAKAQLSTSLQPKMGRGGGLPKLMKAPENCKDSTNRHQCFS
eukprot:scaffold81403_cov18-Tisochrysis_lutea.AAC.1